MNRTDTAGAGQSYFRHRLGGRRRNTVSPSPFASVANLMVVLLFFHFLWAVASNASGAERPESGLPNTNTFPIRLAIGGFDASDDKNELKQQSAMLCDLLTTRLSQSAEFEMVERPAIFAVEREMALTLSQPLKPAEAIRIGGLLRADWLLLGSLLENGETNVAIIKIVDARTGVIRDLMPVSWKQSSLDDAVVEVTEFATNAANRSSRADPRVFLGIGGFEDLGINNRYPQSTRAWVAV